MTTWHKGEPPSDGWWPTRVKERDGTWFVSPRWFDGRDWSCFALPYYSAEYAARCASVRSVHPNFVIEWTDRPARWPKRSRT